MAGRPGRSGKTALMPLQPSSEAPGLDGTTQGNQRFCAWVARELAAGNMDPRTADAMSTAARGELGAIRTAHSLHELEELRSLVDRQERAITSLTKHEQQDRYSGASASATPTLGRVRVSPDGSDPH